MSRKACSANQPPSQTRRSAAEVPEVLTVHVPVAFRRRRGRKAVVTPSGDCFTPMATQHAIENSTITQALARALRWRKLIETGTHSTVRDIAISEKINPSYVSRILRLSVLSPDLIEAIIESRSSFALDQAMKPFPVEWEAQRLMFQLSTSAIRP